MRPLPRGREGLSVPVSPGVLAAMRHVVYGDPKRIVSFVLGEDGLRQLARVSERFLTTQLDRGFRTLDFYKDLVFPRARAGPGGGRD